MENTENCTTAAVVPISVSASVPLPSSIQFGAVDDIAITSTDILTSCQVDDGDEPGGREELALLSTLNATAPPVSDLSVSQSVISGANYNTKSVAPCINPDAMYYTLHSVAFLRTGTSSPTFGCFRHLRTFLGPLGTIYLLFSSSSRRPRFFGRSP